MSPKQIETARLIANSALEAGHGPTRAEAKRQLGLTDDQLTDVVVDEAARLYANGRERKVA